MKLYLKVNLPEGKRVRLIDTATRKIDQRGTFHLYPTESTEVPNAIAEKLLNQDGHLVSKEPFVEAPQDDVPLEVEISPKTLDEQKEKSYTAVLKSLAEIDFKVLSPQQIVRWGKALGTLIPITATKQVKIQMLEDRCEELSKGA